VLRGPVDLAEIASLRMRLQAELIDECLGTRMHTH
jgi:hypothetical protein